MVILEVHSLLRNFDTAHQELGAEMTSGGAQGGTITLCACPCS